MLKIQQQFNRFADTYDKAAVLAREVASRLMQRLKLFSFIPQVIVDLGAGTGIMSECIAQHYVSSQIIPIDIADQLLARAKTKLNTAQCDFVCADAHALPLANKSVDLILSNLMLYWCQDLPSVFCEIQRVLKPEGLLLFSTLGPDTLVELPLHSLLDMHHIGDMLLQASLRDPVVDMEKITLQYVGFNQLVEDLIWLGEYQREDIASLPIQPTSGKYSAIYEIIYGHAFGTDISTHALTEAGEVLIPLHQLKRRI